MFIFRGQAPSTQHKACRYLVNPATFFSSKHERAERANPRRVPRHRWPRPSPLVAGAVKLDLPSCWPAAITCCRAYRGSPASLAPDFQQETLWRGQEGAVHFAGYRCHNPTWPGQPLRTQNRRSGSTRAHVPGACRPGRIDPCSRPETPLAEPCLT